MKFIKSCAIAASFLFIPFTAPSVLAQSDAEADDGAIEEIVVHGRKREESVLEVPVSISVFDAEALAARGIDSQQDLFDATPSLTFDVNTDGRQGTNPGVRGVQSALIATNQQKVNNFIDGMPMLGAAGVLQFDGIQAVEVYRGPQSAAFGRATFAGAINYVTADAAEEFGGKIEVRYSDLGDQQVAASITGPLGDSLGYRLQYLTGEWSGPDEWTSTDNWEMGKQETEQFRAKLNFEFSDSVYGEIMYTRLEADDVSGAGSPVDPTECVTDAGIWRNNMGTDSQTWTGTWKCSGKPPARGVPRNHDVLGQFLAQYDANEAFYRASVGMAWPGLDANMNGFLDSDEYLGQTLPGAGGTYEQGLLGHTVANTTQETTRDRIQGEINFEIGDNVLQIMGMHVDDELFRWFETDNTDTLGSFAVIMGMAMVNPNVMSMAVFNDISEDYLEVRWVSPAESRLRYTLSASYYEYDLAGQVYNNPGALIYGLTLPNGDPVDPNSGITNSEVATNIGVAFGLQYDITERTTFSLEGRYQEDENCGEATFTTGSASHCKTTDAFLPRIALSWAVGDNHIPYVQFSIGNNPAGVNIAYQDPGNILALEVASGQIVSPWDGFTYDGTDGVHFPTVAYDATTFPDFEEETLYNFEIGSKGSYAGGKGTYAAAIYYMEYQDMIGAENLNWNDTNVNGWNEGSYTTYTNERTWINSGDGEYYGLELSTDYAFNDVWRVAGYLVLSSATYSDFCSIQAPQYRDAPGGAMGMGNHLIPILSPSNGDDVLSDCGIVTGNDVPRNSPVSANLDVSATLPNTIWGLTTQFRADVRYQSDYYLDHMNLMKMPALTTLNLSAIMRNEHLNIRLYANNVTDEEDPANVSMGSYYSPNADPSQAAIRSGSWTLVPRRPREIGIIASYSF